MQQDHALPGRKVSKLEWERWRWWSLVRHGGVEAQDIWQDPAKTPTVYHRLHWWAGIYEMHGCTSCQGIADRTLAYMV